MGGIDKKPMPGLGLGFCENRLSRSLQEASLRDGVGFGRDRPRFPKAKPVFFSQVRTAVGLRRIPVNASIRSIASCTVCGGSAIKVWRIVSVYAWSAADVG